MTSAAGSLHLFREMKWEYKKIHYPVQISERKKRQYKCLHYPVQSPLKRGAEEDKQKHKLHTGTYLKYSNHKTSFIFFCGSPRVYWKCLGLGNVDSYELLALKCHQA